MVRTFSNKGFVTIGVPQGSILGPLLSIILVNDAPMIYDFQKTLTVYGDDNTFIFFNKTAELIISE